MLNSKFTKPATGYKKTMHRDTMSLWSILMVTCCAIASEPSAAQEVSIRNPADLKKLSMEELMNVKVTSVSKRAEKLTEVASAIQVITQEDIYRSGATCLAEALRLAPNLQVAQLSSQHWIISARGFNAGFSNKLLVMIDGRTVYSPLFAGVFWDVQQVPLEDVERIEVISGPGGTLWGANAVNGVINIITKSARDTQGLFVSTIAGSYLRSQVVARYGGRVNDRISYRVYAQHNDRSNTFTPDDNNNPDKWQITQAGFRMGIRHSETNRLSIQGNFYNGTEYSDPSRSSIDGQNIMGRWNYAFSEASNMTLQLYYDRTWRRDIPSTISDELETYDLDFQHSITLGKRQILLWGLGYRLMQNLTVSANPIVGLLPQDRNMSLFSTFIQDEIKLQDKLRLTVGSKFQHNVFSGFEIQPSVRMAWTQSKNTVWAAASRAVRAPSRIDVDYYLPTYEVPEGVPHVAGGPNFDSEKVVAYELGYRVQPSRALSFSLATFLNRYDDLYSVEALPNTVIYQIQNGVKGDSRGIEFSGTAEIMEGWKLRGGYTYFYKKLEAKEGHITANPIPLGNDAANRFLVQSNATFLKNFQFDLVVRYISKLPNPHTSDYFTFDARLAWLTKHWEIAIVGQNLYENRHLEYVNDKPAMIPRTLHGKIACRF